MTDPHSHSHSRRLGASGLRRPGIAHVISTLRAADASPVQLLIFHSFDRERPPLPERAARRNSPDVVIELCQN
jgi:hypothetical protein